MITETVEAYFDKCLDLVETYRPYTLHKAKKLMGDEPLLSYINATIGKFDLDELAIFYDLDDRMMLTSYLSGLYDMKVGVVEWILLTGIGLMQNGVSHEED